MSSASLANCEYFVWRAQKLCARRTPNMLLNERPNSTNPAKADFQNHGPVLFILTLLPPSVIRDRYTHSRIVILAESTSSSTKGISSTVVHSKYCLSTGSLSHFDSLSSPVPGSIRFVLSAPIWVFVLWRRSSERSSQSALR